MRYASSHCVYTKKYVDGIHTYTFTGPCRMTGKTVSVTVPGEGLFRYHQGEMIQDCFPKLEPHEREFLMSGYSQEGWKKLMSGSEA